MPRYVVDAGLSRLTVKVFAGGFLSALGHSPTLAMRDVEGEASFTPDSPEEARLTFRVRPETLEVMGDIKASDRREIERTTREEVLEIAKFPEIVFKSSKVSVTKAGEGSYRAEVNGTLTLHGVTQPQTVPAQVSLMGDTLRAFGDVPLRQTPFGIRLAGAAGGALKVKDELKLSYEIVAWRQNDGPKE